MGPPAPAAALKHAAQANADAALTDEKMSDHRYPPLARWLQKPVPQRVQQFASQ
jgi:hypothetical protein